MTADKIKTLSEVSQVVKDLKKTSNKNIGLVTGCFDVVHISHLNLFKAAKEHVDILVVAIDSDQTIRKSKGNNRPLNNSESRLTFLSTIEYIDYVVAIEDSYIYEVGENPSSEAEQAHVRLLKIIDPHILITNKLADKYWEIKKTRAEKLGIQMLALELVNNDSSTKLLDSLLSEL